MAQARRICARVVGCGAQDIRVAGPCETVVVGTYWDGMERSVWSNCVCEGTDCDSVYVDGIGCRDAHRACSAIAP